MTIDELEDKHYEQSKDELRHRTTYPIHHTYLSIQFTVEVLEELNQIWVGDSKMIHVNEVQNKIQELKQYLDEKV